MRPAGQEASNARRRPPDLRADQRSEPTIRDVARQAGVSTATVSRVISGSVAGRPQTRALVLAAADALGYRPSAVARSLKLRTTQTLGLLVTDIQNPYYPEIVRAVEDAAFERNLAVLLCNGADDPAREETYLDLLVDRRVDGIIIASSGLQERHGAWLARRSMPVVLVNWAAADVPLPAILGDNRAGGRLATEPPVAEAPPGPGPSVRARPECRRRGTAGRHPPGVRRCRARSRLAGRRRRRWASRRRRASRGRASGPAPERQRDRLLQRPDCDRGGPGASSPRTAGPGRHQHRRLRRHRAERLGRPTADDHRPTDLGDGPLGRAAAGRLDRPGLGRSGGEGGTGATTPGPSPVILPVELRVRASTAQPRDGSAGGPTASY